MPHSVAELTENALPAVAPGKEGVRWVTLYVRFCFRRDMAIAIIKTTAKTKNAPTEIPTTTGVLLNHLEVCEEVGISSVYALVEGLVAAVVKLFPVETERQ